MSDAPGADVFRLRVPADPALLATIRLFAATVARVVAVHEDVVEDLKLAVSEAAAAAVAAGRHDHVDVTVEVTVGSTVVRVGPLDASDLGGDIVKPGEVIASLFPGAAIDPAGGAMVLSFLSGPGR